MKEKIKQFYYLLDGQAKKGIPFLILAYLLSSMLDVVGIGAVGVFLGLLANPAFFIDKFPQAGFLITGLSEKELVTICGILIVTAFILKTILTIFIQTRVVFFCKSFLVRLKTRMMTAYQHAPYTYHIERNSAHLLSRIQGSADYYVNMLLSTLTFTSNMLIACSILFFLFLLHPFITSFLILMFILLGFGYDAYSKEKVSRLGKISAESIGEVIKLVHHGLQGLIEIRVLNRESYFINALTNISQRYAKSTGILVALQQAPRYLIENTIAIFMVALSIGGVLAGYDSGEIVAMVGVFAVAGARLLPTFNQIMATSHDLRSYYPHMCYVYNDLQELDSLTANSTDKDLITTQHNKLFFETFSLVDIDFQYPNTERLALEKINMQIKKGESIGIVGASGAGKSTLVNLMLGFLDSSQGSLLVDGTVIQDFRSWLNNFAYIPQTIFLLDDTLKRNIALGINDEDIDEIKIWNAINMAQLTEVVHQLPDGIDTIIGERGIRLSGGQRQRIALARAFYHERDIIVMDEATSSLDNETEKEIINTMKRLKGDKTLIVIAHRLTTVEHCDVLYKLEQGKIVSSGSFQQVVGATS